MLDEKHLVSDMHLKSNLILHYSIWNKSFILEIIIQSLQDRLIKD